MKREALIKYSIFSISYILWGTIYLLVSYYSFSADIEGIDYAQHGLYILYPISFFIFICFDRCKLCNYFLKNKKQYFIPFVAAPIIMFLVCFMIVIFFAVKRNIILL